MNIIAQSLDGPKVVSPFNARQSRVCAPAGEVSALIADRLIAATRNNIARQIAFREVQIASMEAVGEVWEFARQVTK